MILECFEYNQHFVAMMNIINHAKLLNKEGKFEKHHIIPRCFYKNKGLEVDNSSSNLVNLTIEEHKKVHQLAYLCAKEIIKSSLDYAQRMMNNITIRGIKHSDETKKKISEAKQNISDETKKKISEAKKGIQSNRKGVKLSEETRKRMSESHKGKNTWSKGRTHSDETRKKLSEAYKGKHWKLIDGKRVWY